MSIFSIFLSALTLVPTNEGDTIQTERLDEVVVVSNSARQRVQSEQKRKSCQYYGRCRTTEN